MDNDRKALARQLAAVMPDWTFGQDPDASHMVYLTGPDGAKLFVGVDHDAPYAKRDERASISGSYPGNYDDRPHSVEHHSISVKISRGAAAIAKDVARRLLPDYLQDLALVQANIIARVNDLEARTMAAARLADALPNARADKQDHRSTRTTVRFSNATGHALYGDVDVNYDGSGVSEMKLRGLTMDQALAIAKIISN